MDRLKVLFITAWYPTQERPVEGVFVREHAKAVQFYDDVIVLHCAGSNPRLRGLWQMEREIDESLTGNIATYRVWHRRPLIPSALCPIHPWSVLQAFRQIIAQGFRPDIIHAHIYYAGTLAVLLGKVFHVPVVVTEHSSAFPRKLLKGTDIWKARLAFEWADTVMPVSQTLQRAIEGYGIKARFQVVSNVVDTRLFWPKPSSRFSNPTKRLLFVGSLDPCHAKGLPYLLYALARLRQQRDDWYLDIVGDGPARAEYGRLVEDLGLLDKITFYGTRPKEEVAEFMRRADLFLLPSLFETFSVVAAEALATGTPVLATSCGGPEEFITEDVGMLVSPASTGALVEGLNHMLDSLRKFSPHHLSRYATERFNPERVGAQIHAVYRQILDAERAY
ncbi:MAG: glycosyltransferase [Anaerolineae bacterium]